MKNKLLLLAAAAALTLGNQAQAEGLFNSKELSLMGFGTYADRQEDSWGGGVGLSYFVTRHIGLGASTHWENVTGSFIDNLSGDAYFRIPLGDLPVAPYAVGSAGYNWELDHWLFGVGGGAEARLNETVGIFGDVQYVFKEGGDKDGVLVRFGFRLNM